MKFFWTKQEKTKEVGFGMQVSGLSLNGQRPDKLVIDLDELAAFRFGEEALHYIMHDLVPSMKSGPGNVKTYITIEREG